MNFFASCTEKKLQSSRKLQRQQYVKCMSVYIYMSLPLLQIRLSSILYMVRPNMRIGKFVGVSEQTKQREFVAFMVSHRKLFFQRVASLCFNFFPSFLWNYFMKSKLRRTKYLIPSTEQRKKCTFLA